VVTSSVVDDVSIFKTIYKQLKWTRLKRKCLDIDILQIHKTKKICIMSMTGVVLDYIIRNTGIYHKFVLYMLNLQWSSILWFQYLWSLTSSETIKNIFGYSSQSVIRPILKKDHHSNQVKLQRYWNHKILLHCKFNNWTCNINKLPVMDMMHIFLVLCICRISISKHFLFRRVHFNCLTVSVSDEGYSRNQSFDCERIWWRVFQKPIVWQSW
jgi:hypothetical protein